MLAGGAFSSCRPTGSPGQRGKKAHGEELIFSKWYEDPDYREEVVVRRYPTGEVLERMDGTLITMPHGQRWLFTREKPPLSCAACVVICP